MLSCVGKWQGHGSLILRFYIAVRFYLEISRNFGLNKFSFLSYNNSNHGLLFLNFP